MNLTKATIEILSRGCEVIEVQFNPNTLAFKKDVVVAEIGIPGLNSPLLQYVRGEAETLDLELFCDTTRSGMADDVRDVREFTDPIRRLVEIDPDFRAPPVIRFSWGKGLSFIAVVVRVEQSFTLFSPAGIPLRAVLQLRLKEFKTSKEQLANSHLESVAGQPPDNQKLSDAQRPALLPRLDPILSRIDIRLDGKPLDDEILRDLLRLTFQDELDGHDAFELTLNNWDEQRRELKYAEALRFDPGTRIEIRLGETGGKSGQPVIKGTIDTVRQCSPADGCPTLVLTGSGTTRRRTKRSKQQPLRLRYGESLIQFEPVLTLARPVSKAGASRTDSGRRAEVTASGTSIGIPELRAGTLIEIQALGERFSGNYLVIATNHTIGDSGYTASFESRKQDK
jgi:hypothetical protein